jgi:hypothetical protein
MFSSSCRDGGTPPPPRRMPCRLPIFLTVFHLLRALADAATAHTRGYAGAQTFADRKRAKVAGDPAGSPAGDDVNIFKAKCRYVDQD